MVVLVGDLDLSVKILLELGSRLGAFEAEGALLAGIASPGAVVILGEGIVLGLGLAHGLLEVGHTLLRGESALLPTLSGFVRDGDQFQQIFVHLVQRNGKLYPVVGHPLVDGHHVLVRLREAASSVLGTLDAVLRRPAELLESVRLLVLEGRSLLQKCRKFLRLVVSLLTGKGTEPACNGTRRPRRGRSWV